MKSNQSIIVQLVDSTGKIIRQDGVIITIAFFLRGKYRYGFKVGPSDEHGSIHIYYVDLEESRLRDLAIQPMDFKTRFEECDDVVEIRMPTGDELIRAADILTTMERGKCKDLAFIWKQATNYQISADTVAIQLEKRESRIEMCCHVRT